MRFNAFRPGFLTLLALEAVASDAAAAGGGGAAATASSTKKEATVEKVVMQDGRTVEFVGKKRMLKDTFISRDPAGNVTGLTVRFDFKNGKVLNFDVLASGLLFELAGHGAEQKLGDAAAGVTDVDEMYLEVEDVLLRLAEGQFNAQRGEGFSGVPMLARAVHEYQTAQGKTKTLEEVTSWLKAKSKDERASIKLHPQIKAILDRLEAEKVKGGVDADALLNAI